MGSWHGFRWLLLGGCVAGCVILATNPLPAAENCQAFVDGLRKRDLYDVALYYLEATRKDPTADKTFLEVIDFETGVTLLGSARLLSRKDREKPLDEARDCFERFLAACPQHRQADCAKTHLADLFVERARLKTAEAAGGVQMPEQKRQLREDARSLCRDAEKLFKAVDADLVEGQKKYKFVDPGDAKRIEERDRVRRDAMLTRLALAKMPYEIAQTYEPGSKENRANLGAAAAGLGEYYRKYSPRLGAYYARIDEARCYQELGNNFKARAVLDEVLSQAKEGEELRGVRNVATLLALQIVLLPGVRKYADAAGIYTAWETATPQHDEPSEEVLAIKCLAGEAALEVAPRSEGRRPRRSGEASRAIEACRRSADVCGAVSRRFPGEGPRQALRSTAGWGEAEGGGSDDLRRCLPAC